ncbi:MAG TPA: YbaB/EbfC family nucleoid-associated protein [Streptosporangiaceae bacterium]|nr:YbaB/EbfC family nucleoid-associated protein [Streptosporangiaceae bacterium]
MDDAVDVAAQAQRIAAVLRAQAATARSAVQAAQAVSYTAGVLRGERDEVTATATGTGRLTSVHLGPTATRAGPEQLAVTLVHVLNQALAGAGRRAAEALRHGLDPAWRDALASATPADPDLVERLAAEQGTGRSPDGEVTAGAAGSGVITAVRFSATALRGGDSTGLAERVAVAANAALDAARRPQRELAATLGRDEAYGEERLQASVDRFGAWMGTLLAELDQAERRITGLESSAGPDGRPGRGQ